MPTEITGIHPIDGIGVPHAGCYCRNCEATRPLIDHQTADYTPGPWAIYNTSSINMIVPAMREGMIADLIDNDANARLISAAPDLLAALEAVVSVADRRTDEFDQARAAIAKARGVQNVERSD